MAMACCGGYKHFSHDVVAVVLLLFVGCVVLAGELVLLEAGIALADDSLDRGELARLFLNTHGGMVCGVVCVCWCGGEYAQMADITFNFQLSTLLQLLQCPNVRAKFSVVGTDYLVPTWTAKALGVAPQQPLGDSVVFPVLCSLSPAGASSFDSVGPKIYCTLCSIFVSSVLRPASILARLTTLVCLCYR